MTVNVVGRYQEATEILRALGAHWIDSTNTSFDADTIASGERQRARGHTLGHEPTSPARPD